MQLLPIGLSIAGSLIQAQGASSAGNANRNALYGAAADAEATAAEQELRLRAAARKTIGLQRAAQAGNGFTGDSGSALDALHESYVNMTLDALQLRRDAASRAKALRAEGDAAASQGRSGAVAAMLGGASGVMGIKSDWAAARAYGGGI